MTIKELHINLEQSLQNLTSFTYDDITSEEADIALNKCLLRKIDDILEGTGDLGFSGNSPNFNKIKRLVKETPSLVYASTQEDTTYIYSLPADYYREIKFKVFFEDNKSCKNPYTGKTEVKTYSGNVRIVSQEEVEDALEDSLRKSTKNSPVATIMDQKLYLYTTYPRTEINSVKLRYIKAPLKIKLQGNETLEYPLPDDFMEDLADRTALHLAVVTSASDKVQLLTSENIK